MKQVIGVLILFFPFSIKAQNMAFHKGVEFTEGLSWAQVKAKAKAENKYIFLDCYATWCGPCKHMDKNIYPNAKVGDAMNEKFISVKVQFDTTARDNEYVRKWYVDANLLNKQYYISGYPTYLFFSPEGKIVHREIGARTFPEEFISIINTALDTNKQYYRLLAQYEAGVRNLNVLKQLARSAKNAGETELAIQIVTDYIDSIEDTNLLSKENINFIGEFVESSKVRQIVQKYKNKWFDKLNEQSVCTKENLEFINKFPFVINSDDIFFKAIYRYPEKANIIMNDSTFSQRLVWFVIRKEEVIDKLYKDGKAIVDRPNWELIRNNLGKKYGSRYADKLVADKIRFYKANGNWSEAARLIDECTRVYPPTKGGTKFTSQVGGLPFGDETTLNENAWQVFLWSQDKIVIKKAIIWSELSIQLTQPNPKVHFLDTRANLLYKLGKVNEAIVQEQQAIDMEIVNAKREGREPGDYLEDFRRVLKKMKSGEQTW